MNDAAARPPNVISALCDLGLWRFSSGLCIYDNVYLWRSAVIRQVVREIPYLAKYFATFDVLTSKVVNWLTQLLNITFTSSRKHVTTFSMISWTRTVHLQWFFGTIGHQQVFLVFHLTYLVKLLYLGKLSRPNYIHEFSLKLLIFLCYNSRILTTKLSPCYFTYLLFNLWFIIEQ